MKNQKRGRTKLGVAMLPLCFALPACGAQAEGADESGPGEVAESILRTTDSTIDTCHIRTPDAVILRPGDTDGGGESRSPTKYGVFGCEKSWVVDLNPNPVAKVQEANAAQWADPWKRNRAQCVGATLKLTVYSSAFDFKSGTSILFPRYEGAVEAPLAWDAAHQECRYGWINVYHRPANGAQPEVWGLQASRDTDVFAEVISDVAIRNLNGRSLRFVASALAPGGGSTQPLWVSSVY